jgi:hypothetical protein
VRARSGRVSCERECWGLRKACEALLEHDHSVLVLRMWKNHRLQLGLN